MGSVPALRAAVDLLHFPPQAALFRARPLPDGVLILLRVAAGDTDATIEACVSVGRPRETVCEAVAFFLEQVLLHPDADSYRVLGAPSEASYAELRRNMTLLLQWLHPDLDRHGARSVFAARVTRAWNDLKTSERRAAYDRSQRLTFIKKSSVRAQRETPAYLKKASARRRVHSGGPHGSYVGLREPHNPHSGFLRRIVLFLFGRSAYWK